MRVDLLRHALLVGLLAGGPALAQDAPEGQPASDETPSEESSDDEASGEAPAEETPADELPADKPPLPPQSPAGEGPTDGPVAIPVGPAPAGLNPPLGEAPVDGADTGADTEAPPAGLMAPGDPAETEVVDDVEPGLDFEASGPTIPAGQVSRIQVDGLRRVEEAAILASVGLRVGEELATWKAQRDIRAIYRTGFVDDVRMEAELTEQGVVVHFIVDEKPAIREVLLKGNKKLDDDALREVLDIAPFSVLNEEDLRRNIGAMRTKYVEKGFYLVEIEPVVKDVGQDMVDLEFEVVENRKVTVQRIEITGNDNLADRKIRKFLQTKQGGILPWLTSSGAFDESLLDVDVEIVRQVFMEEGYVDVKVDKPKVFLTPDKRFVYITINVTEGPRYKLGKLKVSGDFVDLEGLTPEALQRIIDGETASIIHERWDDAKNKAAKDFPDQEDPPAAEGWEEKKNVFLRFDPTHPALKTGDWFKLSSIQMTLQEISDLYGDQGYAFVQVVPDTQSDPEAKVVDITFDVQRGEKVRIGRIDITGNDPTYDKVVRREIPINEGEVYSGSAIKEGRSRLERLGYFEEVRISTPRGTGPDVLDMKVEVTEQPTGSFSVGAGFSNIENFVFTLNVSKNNFLGLGYIMSAAANVSRARQQGNLQLFDPYFLDSRWTLRLSAYSTSQSFIEDEYRRGGTVALGRYLDAMDDIRMEMSYTVEDTGITSLDAYKQKLMAGQLYRSGLTSTGGLSLVIDKRNNRIQATRGIFGTASMNLSGGLRVNDDEVLSVFGGDFNFLETKFNFRAYRPLVEKEWLIFKVNSTLGFINSMDGTAVPFIHRYRAGGIQSVRGYNWYSLGPSIRGTGYQSNAQTTNFFAGNDDPTSAEDRLIVGGTQTWINNFELDMPIIRAAGISTVLFFDAGNAFGDPWGDGYINPMDLRFSYGAGVRWFSPMGPLRFEWGFPINKRPDERASVFDFSIGSLF